MIAFLLNLLLPIVGFFACYLIKFLVGYFYYFALALLARVAWKLRRQVYNEDLKDRPTREQAILITGATSGIGLAMAKHLHRIGYSVIAGYFRKEEQGYAELEQLNVVSKRIHFVELDVTSLESIARSHNVVKQLLDDNKLKLRALINNAGVGQWAKFQWTSRTQIRQIVEVNLVGPLMMTREYLPSLIKSRGRIINISSGLAFTPAPMFSIYCATKAGLATFSRALAFDVKSHHVTTTTIFPGDLIKNTSIGTTSVDYQGVIDEYSDDEKALFKDEIERHSKTVQNGIDKALAYQKGLAQGSDKKRRQIGQDQSLLKTIKKWLFVLPSGCIEKGLRLEDSSFVDSIDNAVRLRSPPLEMHAGNRIYNILVSSVFDTLSHSFIRDMSSLCSAAVDRMVVRMGK